MLVVLLNQQLVTRYRDLCNELLNVDRIVSATVLTMEGSILYSDYKKSSSAISRQDNETFILRAAIRMGTRKEFLEKLGGIKYSFTSYGKMNQYTIPLDAEVKTLLFVAEEAESDPDHSFSNGKSPGLPNVLPIMHILKKYDFR